MLPSEWLAQLEGWSFYPEDVLYDMRPHGFAYRDGTLTSTMTVGFPYLTYGRMHEVPLKTEREIMAEAKAMGLDPVFEKHGTERHVWGFDIVTSVWWVVKPILIARPPSTYENDPRRKAALDLADIRRFGY